MIVERVAIQPGLRADAGNAQLCERPLFQVIPEHIHQFEEYGFPGGEPAIMNRILQASDLPDRFPLNQFSAMFTNVFAGVVLYGLPFFFPDAIWFCLAPMLFNFGQLMVHGVATNRMLKGFFNPGLAAVVFLHLPISIYFIQYVCSTGIIAGWDWLWGFLYAAVSAGLLIGFMTYALFATRKTACTRTTADKTCPLAIFQRSRNAPAYIPPHETVVDSFPWNRLPFSHTPTTPPYAAPSERERGGVFLKK
jgi:hypothetical protein